MKLKQGHCVATANITAENLPHILNAFRNSGCIVGDGFALNNIKHFRFLEWHDHRLTKTDQVDYPDFLLTVDQILCAEDKPYFDLSRRTDDEESLCKEICELQEKYSEIFKAGHDLKLCGDGKEIHISVFAMDSDNDWHSRGELPPVGTQVEYCGQDGKKEGKTYDNWRNGDELDVIAHVKAGDGSMVSIVYHKRYCAASTMDEKFLRPIKSERERAIDSAMYELGCDSEMAAAMYDAGFRKEGK